MPLLFADAILMVRYSVQYFSRSLVTVHQEGYGHGQGVYHPYKEGLTCGPKALPCIELLQRDDFFSGGIVLVVQGVEYLVSLVEHIIVDLAAEGDWALGGPQEVIDERVNVGQGFGVFLV